MFIIEVVSIWNGIFNCSFAVNKLHMIFAQLRFKFFGKVWLEGWKGDVRPHKLQTCINPTLIMRIHNGLPFFKQPKHKNFSISLLL